MKEISDIIGAYDNFNLVEKEGLALVTVVEVEGSSYRRTGARMLVQSNGVWIGGISGGCLEGDALKKANLVMTRKKAMLVTYDTSKDDAYQIGVGLGCNGIITVLISAVDPSDPVNQIELLRLIDDSRKTNLRITIIENSAISPGTMMSPEKAQLAFDDSLEMGKQMEDSLHEGRSKIVMIGEDKLFFEVIKPRNRLVLFGSNYDLFAMLNLGKGIGWKVEIASKSKRIPSHISSQIDEILVPEHVNSDDFTAFILMAHDLNTDKTNLKTALKSKVKYIGMLGPKKRRIRIIEELEQEGFGISKEDKNRIFNPVGLDIGATTPEEIAISAIAEITAFFNHRAGESLRYRKGPINTRD